MRKFILLLSLLFTATAVMAQTSQPKKLDFKGKLASGWYYRLDHTYAGKKDFNFNKTSYGFHFKADAMGAGIYYNPSEVKTGNYQVTAKFDQVTKTRHAEAYGLFIGGQNLQQSNQKYIYFLVRQDGDYLIKRRDGAGTSLLSGWTSSPAINKMDKNGETVNTLSIKVEGEKVDFMSNGKVLKSMNSSDLMSTEGIAGFRLNHHLDLKISDYEVKAMSN
jgi:hypothetical protein